MPVNHLPSFDDFMSRYNPADIADWAADANRAAFSVPIQLPLDEHNVNRFVTAVCAMSTQMSLSILRDYHEWLAEQLERMSLRLI